MGPSGTCKIQRFADGVLLGPDRFGFLGEKRAGDQSLRFEVGRTAELNPTSLAMRTAR
jgi:hypothetical protein